MKPTVVIDTNVLLSGLYRTLQRGLRFDARARSYTTKYDQTPLKDTPNLLGCE